MSRDKRTPAQIHRDNSRAVLRLNGDGELFPVAALCADLDAPPGTIVRWIINGKRGIHLDGAHDPKRGWLSSLAAIARFKDALSAVEAPPICTACGANLMACMIGQPPKPVTICPKCPLPISIAQPAPRQPQPAA